MSEKSKWLIFGFHASATKNNLILKNKNKKIEKFSKNHMYHKKNYKKLLFFLALPWFYYLRSTSNKPEDRHTKNYETFVEFKPSTNNFNVSSRKLLRFFFFLSYSTQYKREEIKKIWKSAFYQKKNVSEKKKTVASQHATNEMKITLK